MSMCQNIRPIILAFILSTSKLPFILPQNNLSITRHDDLVKLVGALGGLNGTTNKAYKESIIKASNHHSHQGNLHAQTGSQLEKRITRQTKSTITTAKKCQRSSRRYILNFRSLRFQFVHHVLLVAILRDSSATSARQRLHSRTVNSLCSTLSTQITSCDDNGKRSSKILNIRGDFKKST